MCNKTCLTNAELELTQKMQMHFPRGLDPEIVRAWNGCTKEVLIARLEEVFGKMPVNIKPEKLLEFIGTVTIPARTEKFVARDRLIVDTSKKAKVKISFIGDNIKNNFLGKIEEPTDESTLCYGKLLRRSVDKLIIANLGCEVESESTLSEMFGCMELQPDGKEGVLLTNGYANIFYIRDSAGVLWAVYCYWHDDGWGVNAYSVESPSDWRAGRQVFSRNPSVSQS